MTLWTPTGDDGGPYNRAPQPGREAVEDWRGWCNTQTHETPYGWAKGTTWPAGLYLVCDQIAPGMYQVQPVGRGNAAYWCCYHDLTGQQIRANDHRYGPSIMVVLATDALVDLGDTTQATLMHSAFGPEPTQWR
jgi:hypothetical protein